MRYLHIFVLVVIVAMTSCKTPKSPMTYFMDIDSMPVVVAGNDYSVKIEPGEELVISVSSSNPEATGIFNPPLTNPAMRSDVLSATSPKLQTFIVDPEGYIDFPMLGKIKVAGYTESGLADMLQQRIKEYVDDPRVFVQIPSYRISVAGEVNRPGMYYISAPRFSILDAISQAGDLNQYGERNNVLLIREEDGVRKHIRLNLNSAELLSSPYFWVKQNDYIYVSPNNVRQDNSEYNQFNSYRLSVISTIVSGSASIISLIIALTR